MTTGFLEQMFNEDQDFPAFVLSCARGMSILGPWREEYPVPERLASDAYYQEAVQDAREHLSALILRWRDEGDTIAEEIRAETLAHYREALARDEERGRKIEAMRAMAEAWTPPPDADAQGLKRFLCQQLAVWDGMVDWYRKRITCWETRPSTDIIAERLEEARDRVISAEKAREQHVERTARAQEWLDRIRASLEAPP